jgi:hypothetical protein
VFATHQPGLAVPFSLSLSATLFFTDRYALFSLTAPLQPFPFQSLPYSFRHNGGCTPSRFIFFLSSALLSCLARASRETVRDFALPRKTRICKSFVFRSLHTLPSSVSCNPFICHSYENNRGMYQLFPFWNSSLTRPRGSAFLAPRTVLRSTPFSLRMIFRTRGVIGHADTHSRLALLSLRADLRGISTNHV